MSEHKQQHGKREAVLTPAQQRERKKKILTVVGIVAGVILLLLLLLRLWVRMPSLPKPGQDGDSSLESLNVPNRGGERRKGVYTFLLAGRDVASGSTDTMILLTYDTKAKTIHGLNLPRDTMINTDNRSKRLNAVYTYNKGKDKDKQVVRGMSALKAEVEKLTGIYPDYYVLVEWEAIGKLVDALDGVEFEVPFDMDYDDPYQDLHIHQPAGLRVLDGSDAMQVIRHRKNNDGSHSGGDVARLQVQQDFLKAVAKRCLQPSTFLKLPELAGIFKENVATDLTVGNILALAEKAMGMDPDTGVSFVTAPIADPVRYHGAAMVTLDGPALVEILNDGMNPYKKPITEKDLQLVYKTGGGFGVTNAELADGMGGGGGKPKPEPQPEPKPEPEAKPQVMNPVTGEMIPAIEDPATGNMVPMATDPETGKAVPGIIDPVTGQVTPIRPKEPEPQPEPPAEPEAPAEPELPVEPETPVEPEPEAPVEPQPPTEPEVQPEPQPEPTEPDAENPVPQAA